MILVPHLIPKSSLKIIKKTGSNTKNLFQDSFDIHIRFKIFESSLGWRQSKPQDSRPRILGEAIHLLKPRIEILSQLDFFKKKFICISNKTQNKAFRKFLFIFNLAQVSKYRVSAIFNLAPCIQIK